MPAWCHSGVLAGVAPGDLRADKYVFPNLTKRPQPQLIVVATTEGKGTSERLRVRTETRTS
jgi:hypothetical protein